MHACSCNRWGTGVAGLKIVTGEGASKRGVSQNVYDHSVLGWPRPVLRLLFLTGLANCGAPEGRLLYTIEKLAGRPGVFVWLLCWWLLLHGSGRYWLLHTNAFTPFEACAQPAFAALGCCTCSACCLWCLTRGGLIAVHLAICGQQCSPY